MERQNLSAEIRNITFQPDTWTVEALDMKDDGRVHMAVFQGCHAGKDASEYAASKYTEFSVIPNSYLETSISMSETQD